MQRPKRRRKPKALSPEQLEDRALDILCKHFGWEKHNLFSSYNRADPNKPYVYKARNKAEERKNEIKMHAARNEPAVYSLDRILSTDSNQTPQNRRKQKQHNPPTNPPIVSEGPQLPDWTAITAQGPNPRNPRKTPTPIRRRKIRQP